MKKLKLYIETSVWSHYYADDVPEKMADTRTLFELISKQGHRIYISRFVITEIEKAREDEKNRLQSLIRDYKPSELEASSTEYKLADRYLKAFALPKNSHTDAMHAAMTSIYKLDILVTWNCRHLAGRINKDKINMVNIRNGYRPILIFTPTEVIRYERI